MYKDLIWTELFCDVLPFPNSRCISSEMSKILFTKYFSPSRTNYKFVTPLSFHQNNNYSRIYWIITFTIIDQSGCKTDHPKPGPFSLTIQPRKQKALGTRLLFGCKSRAWFTEEYNHKRQYICFNFVPNIRGRSFKNLFFFCFSNLLENPSLQQYRRCSLFLKN
jgi:hypothetical protein